MKILLCVLLMAFAVCFADNKTIHNIIPNDSTKTHIIDSSSSVISEKNILEALKKSEDFYSSAFDKIQTAFDTFVNKVNVITIIVSSFVSVFVAIFTWIFTTYAQKEKNELKKYFSDFEIKLTEKYDIEKEKMEILHKSKKESFENLFEKYRIEFEKAKEVQELTLENHYLLSDLMKRMNEVEERLEKLEKKS